MQWATAKTAHIHFLYGNIHLLKQGKNNKIILNTFIGIAWKVILDTHLKIPLTSGFHLLKWWYNLFFSPLIMKA